jgi:hypothetical protein
MAGNGQSRTSIRKVLIYKIQVVVGLGGVGFFG